VALGDALGRATEFLTREQIRAHFGWLTQLAAPPHFHPAHAHPPGIVTDDTAQTLLIAQLLARGETLTPENVAAALVKWSDEKSLQTHYIGPSTRRALAQLKEGVSPRETGKSGTTNGAAMRVAAIGIIDAGNFDRLMNDVIAASAPTHNTRNAIQGGAAVGCAIAEAMSQDSTVETVIAAAQHGAMRGREHGAWSWCTPLEKRIELAVRLAREGHDLDEALQKIYDYVGTGLDPAESVAAAFGVIAAARSDATTAINGGVNIGGDTDTVASIAGAICGALHGIESLDQNLVRDVERVNGFNLDSVARELTRPHRF
jgi:ADP-ribosylglycohydrolase